RARASTGAESLGGPDAFRLCATKSSTATICSLVTSNCSITSSTLKSSRFSMTVATGNRVSRNTHAPPTLPGMLSTAGHCDQSRLGICTNSFSQNTLRAIAKLRCRHYPAPNNRLETHLTMISEVIQILAVIQPGQIIEVFHPEMKS